ncbi:universal stress protein [Magnetospira sp. QH-2]|uniref:universal stress protein n=1 Tax=Magnetospira sp. (strain QH-2) TaxID=1288970 RepID=UPI0003E81AFF|nr:universal stress protein [Magnetospira sp. QH-2]CCQ74407.1 putative universal stress protein UspA and related nucleotide-binding proteins [Magnetospira sp. QH-2]
MTLRTILVPVDGSDSARSALDAAIGLGRDFMAHVDVIHVKSDPKNALPMLGEGMSGAMIEEMMELAEKESADLASAARNLFDEATTANNVTVADQPPGPNDVSASWREVTGREDEVIARSGRVRDLVLLPFPTDGRDGAADQTLNAALYETGKPVLMTPSMVPDHMGRRIVVAWNGSAEATRAVSAAMPFLLQAEAVYLLSAESENDEEQDVGEVATYLSWHGVTTTSLVFSPGGLSIGEALLGECGKVEADLLVMGAYSHSRVWEMVLGGVTRHILEEASLPVLMAH